MSRIDFIYFDVGQVLVSMKQGFDEFCLENAFSSQQKNQFDTVWGKYSDDLCKGTITSNELTQKLNVEAGVELPDDFDIRLMTVKAFQPISPIQSLLVRASTDYQIGLLSNAYQDMIDNLIKQHKLPQIEYSAIVDSFEEKVTKPDGRIYQIATKKAATDPHNIFFIDDSQKNIKAARLAGWQTFQFDENHSNAHVDQLTQILFK